MDGMAPGSFLQNPHSSGQHLSIGIGLLDQSDADILYFIVYSTAGHRMTGSTAGMFRADPHSSPSARPGTIKSLCCGLHAECDVAALVYRPGDDPDQILSNFLHDLRICGYDAAGLLQRRRSYPRDARDPVEFYLLPGGGTEAYGEKHADAIRCSAQLPGLCKKLLLLLERRPDIVVLNRFGSLEVCGLGLMEVLNAAIDRDVPVLIAVPEALFRSWLSAVQGLAVKLRNRNDLDRWWQSVQPAPARGPARSDFCGSFK
jgi:hypothetical protein